MKKLAAILMAVLLLSAALGLGILSASAATENAPCTAEGCTGSYENGFCSADGTHYEAATLNDNGTAAHLADDYYEIGNAGQLYWFADKVNNEHESFATANARLTADITINSNVLREDGTPDPNGSFLVWTPIGITSSYAGTFDGAGKTVSGIYVNAVNEYYGLIGYNEGVIKNVGVIDSYVKGNYYIGGVAGANNGLIKGCYFVGTVSGNSYVGGVVGESNGDIIDCYHDGIVSGADFNVGGVAGETFGDITGCYHSGTVSGNTYVGGVAGSNSYAIRDSYNTGNVSLNGNYCVGGLAGESYGSITNCYNTGNISSNVSNSYVGGLAGYADNIIKGSYNTGDVSGSEGSYVGGLVGYNNKSIEDSRNAGSVSNGFFVGGLTGECYGDILNSHNTGDVTGGESGYYIGGLVGHAYGDIKGSYNTGKVSGSVNDYTGGLVGYGHSRLEDSYNTGTVSGSMHSNTGGLAGEYSGSITNCYNTGDVSTNVSDGSSTNYVGGLIGLAISDITGCHNTGNVSGGSFVGGLTGESHGTIRDSYNSGDVSGSENGYYIGGLSGRSSSNIKACYNSGDVSGYGYVGGLVGYNGQPIKACYNTGDVSGGEQSYVGGLTGINEDSVQNCYSIGTVSGKESGFVGAVSGGAGGIFKSTYYLMGAARTDIGEDSEAIVFGMPEEAFRNGTVAWLLNEAAGLDVFGQILSGEQKDPSPVFLTDSNRIYFGYTTCDAAETTPVYSNLSTAAAEKPAHQMAAATCAAPSSCTVCGHTEGEATGEHSYDNACDVNCNICGAERTVGEHTDADKNALCDACGTALPKNGLSAGAIVGIVLGSVAVVGIGGFALYWFAIKKKGWSDLVSVFRKK